MRLKNYLQIIVLLFTGIFILPSWADMCSTHEICSSTKDCACMVGADSAYERAFYIDFQAIQQGHNYECKLNSFPTQPLFLRDKSTFPQGSMISQCSGDCLHFPTTLLIDTHSMSNKEDTLILKYQVQPSDYPSNITASCKLKE